MARQQQVILTVLENYYGETLDIDDHFYETVATSDMEMLEIVAELEKESIILSSVPHAYEFDLVNDFLVWCLDNQVE